MTKLARFRNRLGHDSFRLARSTRPVAIATFLVRPKYMLLVGRRPSPEDRQVLEEARRQSEWSDVEVIHYDDLVDFARQRVDLATCLAVEVRSALE